MCMRVWKSSTINILGLSWRAVIPYQWRRWSNFARVVWHPYEAELSCSRTRTFYCRSCRVTVLSSLSPLLRWPFQGDFESHRRTLALGLHQRILHRRESKFNSTSRTKCLFPNHWEQTHLQICMFFHIPRVLKRRTNSLQPKVTCVKHLRFMSYKQFK